ncbi:MAG: class I poly(R)-hydroxyalkanoic acid synthase [Rhodospirillaceae bacterium]|nr:class I poly(R)-hydroxyalkanoic acid synthase [Rhodospirillaceae bacterium]
MTEQNSGAPGGSDPINQANEFARMAAQAQRIVADFIARQQKDGKIEPQGPFDVSQAFAEMTQKMMADPARVLQAQMGLWENYVNLWQHTATRMMGGDAGEPVVQPAADDRRFRAPEWQENHFFDFVKQSYLLTSNWFLSTVKDTEGLDEKSAQKLAFYTRQYVDALSPTNFALSNPTVLQETLDSGGANLLQGLRNLLDDLERGGGKLNIRMSDKDDFTVGENIAVTPGKVVFQNDLIQLIQYAPQTKTVHTRPLLVIAPWINKFYVLDLKPKNSLIRWAVEQGYTVFAISWVNPDEALAHKSFENYMLEGPLAALDAIEAATGEKEVAAVGYCLGGTLLSATLAYMAASDDKRITSATFLATLVDFAEPGELGLFIDEEQLASLEEMMREKGYLDGGEMAATFNLLRANDLIWSFVINNYLMGREPFPFDLLYWNADSTRMPAEMHSFYLRKMYQDNALAEPGGIELNGVPIDLGNIKLSTYVLAAHEDHIAPWLACFKATGLYSGKLRFVLGQSGHIAGVVNPPEGNKYGYWTGKLTKGESGEQWHASAERHEGSWWTDWQRWQSRLAGKKVAAREPGAGKLEIIEDAPGSYVKVRI